MRLLRSIYHYCYAFFGAFRYGFPSKDLFVIGVTGTSGKSTTVHFLRHLLEEAGYAVGSLSTVDFYIKGKVTLNDKKMTMLGRSAIQKYLREMVRQECDIAIVETTSEGAVQHRHRFINYDTMLLTNLYPEHIESHGSFEAYKGAKLGIFSYVAQCRKKYRLSAYTHMVVCNPYTCVDPFEPVPKTGIVFRDIDTAHEFLSYPFDRTFSFGTERGENLLLSEQKKHIVEDITVADIMTGEHGISFSLSNHPATLPFFGEHNALNAAAATSVLRSLGVSWERIVNGLGTIPPPPGRVEFIREVEAHGFRVIVDYAFEPVAMQALYTTVSHLSPKRVIQVFGGTGGGRDTSRREILGQMAGSFASVCIVTNEDPYDEDPKTIIEMVAKGVRLSGKKDGVDLFCIEERGDAIEKAIGMAKEGDIILVTGKGSEQAICVADGKKIPWDDRESVRSALKKRNS